MKRQTAIPLISLFSGPGGLDLGFRRAGFKTILAIDSNKAAVETYNRNTRPAVAQQCDLNTLQKETLISMLKKASPGQVPRGVIGGPPCQSFSLGNVRKKRHDRRSRQGLVFARLVQALNQEFGLDFFLFENVLGLRTSRHRNRFKAILRELRKAGFNLFVQELDCGAFGVAQRRRRLIVVGINRAKYPWVKFEFPIGSAQPATVRDVIGGLPRPTFYRRGLKPRDIPFHPNHWTMNPLSPKFRNGIFGNGRSFKKLDWKKPSYTVAYGNREIHVHPDGHRRLSVLEAMLLQGFPGTYQFQGTLSDQITQVSDAVPPALGEAVARAIKLSIYSPITKLQASLLGWFKQEQRRFPWRQTRDPFRVLLAEKLLQQTAATRAVVRAFREIVRRYPSWAALAEAPRQELKRIVAPLGFAYRAVELRRLARAAVQRHGGSVPPDLKSLLALPGIGDYSARAVMSFAFRQPFAVVDTNVARFLLRYFGLKLRLTQNPARDRRLQRIADAVVPPDASRDFNLAVLDLCASHCKARQPECNTCPVRAQCAYWNTNVRGAAVTLSRASAGVTK